MRKTTAKALIGSTISVITIVGLSSAAFAGENKGNGEKNPNMLNARSACAFSGLDEVGFGEQAPDDQDGEEFGNPDFEFERTQNFGQLVRLLDSFDPQAGGAAPRFACNGSGGG
jgi:hypothetical protein